MWSRRQDDHKHFDTGIEIVLMYVHVHIYT